MFTRVGSEGGETEVLLATGPEDGSRGGGVGLTGFATPEQERL